MRRREFLLLSVGAATCRPFAASAQQSEQLRRIGVLTNVPAVLGQPRVAVFLQVLQQLGWSDGRNLRIDTRFAENNVDLGRRYAAELLALAPDIILASGTPAVLALQSVTRTLPIVFVQVSDPVGAGVVDSLARPGGNTTGFMNFEYSLSGKWVEILKKIAPWVTRTAVLRDTTNPAGNAEFGVIQAAAQSGEPH
jgi:putative tryptophan/tyrosine transport system substrate-binding protein